MNKIKHAARAMASLSVYKGILQQPVPRAFYRLLWSDDGDDEGFLNAWGNFFSELSRYGCSADFAKCITETVMYDENVFSKAAAAGETAFPENIIDAVTRDINVIMEISSISPGDFFSDGNHGADVKTLKLPKWETGKIPDLINGASRECASRLQEYYKYNGFGIFAKYRAFIWQDKRICPVFYPDKTRLSDLKGYEAPRSLVVNNTLAFLNGLPANNCLLYGESGTGKSSTVKALLNDFYKKGLRMVEMPKNSVMDFPLLVNRIAGLPMKFIIFIDDLSLSKDDDIYASLKSVIEGGLAAKPDNSLIYATSNHRHILREDFSGSDGSEIHLNDTIQENISLSDRFGLVVNFSLPGKEEYLDIVHKLASDRNITVNAEELEAGAETWAKKRGERSPRCAGQYIRAVEAKIKSR